MGVSAQTVASMLRGSFPDFAAYNSNSLSCRSSSISPPISPASTDITTLLRLPDRPAAKSTLPIIAGAAAVPPRTQQSHQLAKSPSKPMSDPNALTANTSANPPADGSWLDPAIAAIVSCIDAARPTDGLKILSQALPFPSSSGNAYPQIIKTVRARTIGNRFTWLSLLHAIPRRTLIADMPQSPSANHKYLIDNKDFAGCRVFDSAVPAIDYETCSPEEVAAHGHALAPPLTINLSIVERLIPPTSSNEVRDMFNPEGSSLLIDRMTELSPDNGCLAFIYPTTAGARTFVSEYLGPVLDPVLRSNIIMHNLSKDFGEILGRMHSVEQLFEFEEMQSRIVEMFRALSDTRNDIKMLPSEGEATGTSARVGEARRRPSISSNFSLIHATKTNITLDKRMWVDWWIQQEQPRIANSIMKYYRTSGLFHPEISQASLVQSIMDGVRQRAAAEPSVAPIEVAVFVICRER